MVPKHRPKHINQTKNPYFITGRTYFGLPYFDTDEKKELALLSAIRLACENYHLALDGWVILDNHYHLLFRPPGCNWEIGIADKSATTEEGADKSAISETNRGPHTAWWDIKYREEIKRENIALYGKRSQLAEKKRAKEFERLVADIADKSATSNLTRSSELARDMRIADKSANSEIANKFATSKETSLLLQKRIEVATLVAMTTVSNHCFPVTVGGEKRAFLSLTKRRKTGRLKEN